MVIIRPLICTNHFWWSFFASSIYSSEKCACSTINPFLQSLH